MNDWKLQKNNRISRKEYRKEAVERELIWPEYFEKRRTERKISKNLVVACIKKGKIIEQNNAFHYVLNNLHVVVDHTDEVLITTYFEADMKEAA